MNIQELRDRLIDLTDEVTTPGLSVDSYESCVIDINKLGHELVK